MMEFDAFINRLQARLKEPLPGSLAHEPLRAIPSGDLKPSFTHLLPPKPGSILILLYPHAGTIMIPLTRRAEYAGAHSGQISFPGGKREAGEDEITNALRECEEEIGVSRDAMRVIGKLSNFFVIPSNFMVTPVIAVIGEKPSFIPDPVEVVEILECDIYSLVREDAVRKKEILAASLYPMIAPHFEVAGQVVWGATAMMLNEFRMLAQEVLKI